MGVPKTVWIKLYVNFRTHSKGIQVGPLGRDLFICSLAWSAEYLTDGQIPAHVLPFLAPGLKQPQRAAVALVEAGLWETTDTGWRIHEYEMYQQSKAEVEDLHDVRAEAGRRSAAKRKQTVNNVSLFAEQTLQQTASKPIANRQQSSSKTATDIDIEVEVEEEGGTTTTGPPAAAWGTPQDLVKLWNDHAPPGLPRVGVLSEARRKRLASYLRQFPDRQFWRDVIAEYPQSGFLLGHRNGPGHEHFKADLDWLCSKGKNDNVENCVKVREKKYRDDAQIRATPGVKAGANAAALDSFESRMAAMRSDA
jgi:hypothetical protein